MDDGKSFPRATDFRDLRRSHRYMSDPLAGLAAVVDLVAVRLQRAQERPGRSHAIPLGRRSTSNLNRLAELPCLKVTTSFPPDCCQRS
jgi:hypothetical protein